MKQINKVKDYKEFQKKIAASLGDLPSSSMPRDSAPGMNWFPSMPSSFSMRYASSAVIGFFPWESSLKFPNLVAILLTEYILDFRWFLLSAAHSYSPNISVIFGFSFFFSFTNLFRSVPRSILGRRMVAPAGTLRPMKFVK